MALPPINTTEDSFLREVDEELRRDQLTGFWKQWGRWIVAAVGLGLAALAGWLVWQDRQFKAASVESEQLDDALRKATAGNDAGTRKAREPLKASSNEGYRATALFTDAALLLQKRDLDGAAKLYGQIATDQKIPAPWRDLALIRQTSVQFDRMAPDEVIARLSPLAIKGNPWFGSAGELVAIAYLKKDRIQPAAKLFADIASDEGVPETIRGRAANMAASLSARSAGTTKQGKL